MRKHRFHFAFGVGCGIGMVLLTWLLGTDSLADSHLNVSSALSSFLGFLNVVPFFLSAILSGSDFGEARGEFAYWALIFAQWVAIGIVISALVPTSTNRHVKA